MPFNKLKDWLNQEKEQGISEPDCAVLATCTDSGIPHSRVVAIREIKTDSLLFFTQRKTRKVSELLQNPKSSLTFLFAMQRRQVILEGTALPLSPEENTRFWNTLPRDRQLRFTVLASSSGHSIEDLTQLDSRKKELINQLADLPVPVSEDYCGFRFIPQTWIFYTVDPVSFSEVLRYTRVDDTWKTELLSP